jgi:hypothetical protein
MVVRSTLLCVYVPNLMEMHKTIRYLCLHISIQSLLGEYVCVYIYVCMFIVFVFFSSHYFPLAPLLVLLPNLKKIPKRKSVVA